MINLIDVVVREVICHNRVSALRICKEGLGWSFEKSWEFICYVERYWKQRKVRTL